MVNCWRVGAQTDPYLTFNTAFNDPLTTATNFTTRGMFPAIAEGRQSTKFRLKKLALISARLRER